MRKIYPGLNFKRVFCRPAGAMRIFQAFKKCKSGQREDILKKFLSVYGRIMGSQFSRKPALSAVGTKYGGMSIVALPLHFVLFAPTCRDFQLDQKEGQKREFLSQDVGWQIKTKQCSRPPPLFCRAGALDIFFKQRT